MDRTWHNGIKLDKTRINPSEKSTDDKDWYIVEPICTRFTTEQKNWQPPGHHFLSLPSVPTHLLTYMCELNTHTVCIIYVDYDVFRPGIYFGHCIFTF